MRTLDDHEHLVLPELVELLVWPADMADDADAIRLFEHDGVVRGDEAGRGVGHDRRPGVLSDEPLDLGFVLEQVTRCVPHAWSFGHQYSLRPPSSSMMMWVPQMRQGNPVR